MASEIAMHPKLAIGGIVVILLVGIYVVKTKGTPAVAAASNPQDLSGLATDANGNKVVYIPTSTSFYTDNSITAGKNASVTANSPINTSLATTTSTSTTSTVVNPARPTPPPVHTGNPTPVVPITQPTGGTHPVHATPAPTPFKASLQWSKRYTVVSGNTLSGIAATATQQAKQAGAPNSTLVTWQQIYGKNKSTIDNTARQHGNPIPGGAQNNIFPGENLIIPQWVRG